MKNKIVYECYTEILQKNISDEDKIIALRMKYNISFELAKKAVITWNINSLKNKKHEIHSCQTAQKKF